MKPKVVLVPEFHEKRMKDGDVSVTKSKHHERQVWKLSESFEFGRKLLKHDRGAKANFDPYDMQGMPARRCQSPKAKDGGVYIEGSVFVGMSQKYWSCTAKESCVGGELVKDSIELAGIVDSCLDCGLVEINTRKDVIDPNVEVLRHLSMKSRC